MRIQINDGGPAFPRTGANGYAQPQNGMTLRNYLSAQCPLTLEASAKIYGIPLDEILRNSDHTMAFMAMDAHMRANWADAMLVEQGEHK